MDEAHHLVCAGWSRADRMQIVQGQTGQGGSPEGEERIVRRCLTKK